METLLLERSPDGTVAVVILNRPEVLNAVNTRMGEELVATLRELGEAEDLRAVVLSAAGTRAFCCGADLKERDGMTDAQWFRQHRIFQEVTRLLREFPSPTIAAVEGFAMGGGCEIALSCDLIVATTAATFALPEVTRGIIPGIGGTQLLPRLVGRARAKELLYTGRRWTAQDAAQWGMVLELAAPGAARARAEALAGTIAKNAPIAVRQAKRAVDLGADIELQTALGVGLQAYAVVIPSEDRREGVRAFQEKRTPQFRNR